MEYDAFTGGIEPGGLRSKNDIRILICYILQSVNAPLSGEDIIAVLQKHNLVNYFEASDAISSLVKHGNIKQEGESYVLCETGREIAESLDTSLPLSVRDKVLEAAFKLLARAKNERDNKVEIKETEGGYKVTCHISDGQSDMMTLSLRVPDERQAKLVKECFYADPTRVYELMLAALSGDKEMQKSLFED